MSRRRWALGLLISLCTLAAPAQARWRPPRIVVADARVPVRIEQATVQAELAGPTARTQIELVLRNPNDRVLEASLEFPLQEGQSVSGFALDIGGQLRPAVPVEKARG